MENYNRDKEITRENIVNNFDYYDFVALADFFQMKNFELGRSLVPVRLDLELRDKPVVVHQGVEGKMNYSDFYSLEYLKSIEKKVHLIANFVCSVTEMIITGTNPDLIKEQSTGMQFWGCNYKEIWKLKFDKERRNFFLRRLDTKIDLPPRNWGD